MSKSDLTSGGVVCSSVVFFLSNHSLGVFCLEIFRNKQTAVALKSHQQWRHVIPVG